MDQNRQKEIFNFLQYIKHKRVTIFTGHYGSGKTELALNYATYLQKHYSQLTVPLEVILVDLDLVNPYFRSQEAKKVLEKQGIKAVVPPDEMRGSDLPVIVTEAFAAFAGLDRQLVVDVGGDDQGVLALGQFRQWLTEGEYDFWLVVNPYRPFNENVDGIKLTRSRIEAASRLRLTGLISNPNLGRDTTPEIIGEGHQIVEAAARDMELPIEFLAVNETVIGELNPKEQSISEVPVLPIKIFVYPDWLNE